VLHLVRVTSGLDSVLVGEEQIRGQVREALRTAEACQPLSSSLRGVFQRAIESARRIRGSTRMGQVPAIAAAGVSVVEVYPDRAGRRGSSQPSAHLPAHLPVQPPFAPRRGRR